MTCIVGIANSDVVVIGGDSAGVSGYDVRIRHDPKVFVRGEFLIGFTYSFRMGQLLQYTLDVPLRTVEMLASEYMATVFVDSVRLCFTTGGHARKINEEEAGGEFLVAYEGVLYHIHNDYQVAEYVNGVAALGCGASYAYGAVYTLRKDIPKAPATVVRKALDAAEEYSTGVASPFTILSTGGKV